MGILIMLQTARTRSKRLFIVAVCLVYGLTYGFGSQASTDEDDTVVGDNFVVQAFNLQQDAASAGKSSMPIVLAFSAPWCDYCEAMEQEVLEPLLRSGDYDDKMILRKLEVTDSNQLIGFDGQRIASGRIARRYNVDIYPTLVFINAKGNEISQRIVGITLLDYVFADIDAALATARLVTREQPGKEIGSDI